MSYDTVALVAQEPDLATVARVLEHIAPGLWLQPHTDSGLLELRDDRGSLLAAVEPGLALGSRQEIGRLLGPEQQDAAPDPCWWVETRARPDAAGHRIADDVARTLTARLGGTAWASGQADTTFRAQTPHPAADQVTDHAVLVTQDRPVVPWSSWLADAVVRALGEADVLDTLWARHRTGRSDTTHEPAWRAPGSALGFAVGPRRVRLVGLPATENGPLPGTPFGPPEHRSVWYPALGDVDDPGRAPKALRTQWEHLAAHAGKGSPRRTTDEQ
ncbi:hypothetical protein GCM10007079_06020 [Nocardiopsis terrae]|uniref:DUF317 domain-containing protein n=1 Tax=Nocardiopsis terrae TaxID=372655 RepID=A0ABR9HP56_9ACTN|nr:DUF6177 family protein [Nocardiopsis terrae]MBE1460650.1 hypothetical protein [Nocardiopsis terrae]GHC72654.1 hypothetical protein GCM10007079_06020 [Nocardiopsis terrae]